MPKGIPKNGINKGWIKKGQKFSDEYKHKISVGHKGKKPHDFSSEIRNKMSQSAKKRMENDLGTRMWGGSHKEYLAIHYQVRKAFGKPSSCENCGLIADGKRMQWANKNGVFNLERKNWTRLCTSCHYKYDHE